MMMGTDLNLKEALENEAEMGLRKYPNSSSALSRLLWLQRLPWWSGG